MNNEEKILPEQDAAVENTNSEKKLSKGALIGIIGGAAALVVVAVLLVVFLGGNKKPECTHVDKDDDYLCDNCGEHFDDGDEVPEQPAVTAKKVTFIAQLDDGTPLSGIKFALVRGETRQELESGSDGKVSLELEQLAYSIEYDYDSLPEYCTPDLFGFKVEEGTGEVVLVITDNTPDGSLAKPFPVLENEIAVTIGAGEEFNYVYRGASVKFITFDNEDVEILYDGNTYGYGDEIMLLPEIGKATMFSVKNPTASEISFTLTLTAPLGSSENPYELTEGGASVTVNCESVVYYSWTATKDGIITLTCDNERNNISLTRILENDVPEMVETNGLSTVSLEVKEGEVVTIAVSALEAGKNHQNQEFDIEVSFSISIE